MSPIPVHRAPATRRGALTLLLLAALLLLWPPRADAAPRPEPGRYVATVQSRAVHFGLSGFEPDFDPLYRLVLVATLRDTRPAPAALPPATLLLGAYLENFQPGTTPLLPDLLHPNQVATQLDGFLRGKAALVTAGGRTTYRGSLLGEVMQTDQLRLVVTLDQVGAPDSAPSLRLIGTLTLARNGRQRGTLVSAQLPARAALLPDVPSGTAIDWRTISNGLGVRVPPMMGIPGGAQGHKPTAPDLIAAIAIGAALHPALAPTAHAAPPGAGPAALWGDGIALLCVSGLGGLWWSHRRLSGGWERASA